MIAITGASGQLGRLIIEELLRTGSKPNELIALVRNPEKVKDLKDKGLKVRYADYNVPSSLTDALQGVDKLMLVSGSEIGQRVAQHKAVIESAIQNKVEFIAYTSFLKADKSPMAIAGEHRETENMLKASNIPYTILRNGWYVENYSMTIDGALKSGRIFGSAKDAKFSPATRRDYAKAASKVLTSDGHAGKTYELAGDEAFTMSQLAEMVSKVSGNPVTYTDMSEAEYAKLLLAAGVPEMFATMLSNVDTLAQGGWLFDDGRDLSKLIGTKTESIRDSIRKTV